MSPATYISGLTAALERHLCRVQRERMADVPILNPRLAVQAVDFRPCAAGWLGVMITPWFISLVLLPAEGDDWSAQAVGSSRPQVFASGRYVFLLAEAEGVGRYQSCSLLSPVLQVADQSSALAIARAALQAVDDAACRDGAQPVSATSEEPHPLSRRDFLRGRLRARAGEAGP